MSAEQEEIRRDILFRTPERLVEKNEGGWHRRLLSRESRSWLVGYARAGLIFAICFGIALLSKQYPKFYFHAVFAVVSAAVFGGLAWLFRPKAP